VPPGRAILGAKILLWLLCLAPAARLAQRALTGRLTANPIEFITLHTGYWALVMLVATLAVTPVRRITGWNRLIQLRRPLGLFAFFYATLHFLTYVALDRFFAFGDIGEDILKRPYITVGFTAFLLLVPLAVTSTRGWIRRLGRRWTRLHWLIYPAVALAILHFYWKRASKADIAEPLTFAAALALLFAFRIVLYLNRRRISRQRAVG
jgi:methionine sulfoxide reductase heme-binding subunit